MLIVKKLSRIVTKLHSSSTVNYSRAIIHHIILTPYIESTSRTLVISIQNVIKHVIFNNQINIIIYYTNAMHDYVYILKSLSRLQEFRLVCVFYTNLIYYLFTNCIAR